MEIIKIAHDFAKVYESYQNLVNLYNQSISIMPQECDDALTEDFANVFYNLAKKIVDIKEN